jgi:hypothetical protein
MSTKYLSHPKEALKAACAKGYFNFLSDRTYLKLIYWLRMGKALNLKNPQTFNEKLQWLKLYDRRPEYTTMVDKYQAKKYVADRIGEEYIIPTFGVWDKFEDIDFGSLPNEFVLKSTHDSGGVVIVRDKSKMDIAAARKKINTSLNKNYFWGGREWPYKNIKPRIICEKYMVSECGSELIDYKFYCFHGEPKVIQVISERNNGHYYIDHYDLEWNKFIIPRKNYSKDPVAQDKPKDLDEMISISRELSKNIPFARIDLYNTESGISFGEITFFPVSGFIDFSDQQTDYLLGSWLRLPQYKI